MKLFAVLCGLALSATAAAQPVNVVLRVGAKVSMDDLAKSVSDPSSPRYHKFYTPQEIRAVAGPTDAEYRTLVAGLEAHHLMLVSESTTHLVFTVRGEKADVEQAFKVSMRPAGQRYAMVGQPKIPADIAAVVSVEGLDTTKKFHPHYRFARQDFASDFKGVPLQTIRTLYGFDGIYQKGINGAGQHIAIATYDDFNLDEVNQYFRLVGLQVAPVVDRVTFNGQPTKDPSGSAVETQLDAEFSGALAPGARIHVFTSAENSEAGETALFTAILDDNRAKVVNYSWGLCESAVSAQHKTDMDKVFARAVAQGVTVTVATGDSGSSCDGVATQDATPDYPASQPDILAVGGTTLDFKAPVLSEKAWSGSGGGVSNLYAQPAYQAGFQFAKRAYPDVAFNADPASGQAVFATANGTSPSFLVVGGTSIAAPQWAAFLTLVAQARQDAGLSPLGFATPCVYSVGDPGDAISFDDVTKGSNGKFTAGPGWDQTTGFGGLKASGLLDAFLAY